MDQIPRGSGSPDGRWVWSGDDWIPREALLPGQRSASGRWVWNGFDWIVASNPPQGQMAITPESPKTSRKLKDGFGCLVIILVVLILPIGWFVSFGAGQYVVVAFGAAVLITLGLVRALSRRTKQLNWKLRSVLIAVCSTLFFVSIFYILIVPVNPYREFVSCYTDSGYRGDVWACVEVDLRHRYEDDLFHK